MAEEYGSVSPCRYQNRTVASQKCMGPTLGPCWDNTSSTTTTKTTTVAKKKAIRIRLAFYQIFYIQIGAEEGT
jgi:hypothetical protein